jgi:hypothetical protein
VNLRALDLSGLAELATKKRQPGLLFARKLWRLFFKSVRIRFWKWWGSIFPYQRLTYKGKILAWGRDRAATYRLLFPTAPFGKTILDVGCHRGFYCFQAASEGAKYCLGIDIDPGRIGKGQALIQQERIPNIDLVAADIHRYNFNCSYDITLCLNLLQHLKTIDRVEELLTRLHQVATERLILVVPLTTTPGLSYEYALCDNMPYVLLSKQFFQKKYGEGVHVLDLPPFDYGPNRAAVIINKEVTTSAS